MPNCCTKPSAVCAKRSRRPGSRATAANGSLPFPPPPTDSTTRSLVYLRFSRAKELRQPLVAGTSPAPATSICASAHSSLSCRLLLLIHISRAAQHTYTVPSSFTLIHHQLPKCITKVGTDLPGKGVENMRYNIKVQGHGRPVFINVPVRKVDSVPIHGLQWRRKLCVVVRWGIEVRSAHCRWLSAKALAASMVLHVRSPCRWSPVGETGEFDLQRRLIKCRFMRYWCRDCF